jgi:hypothetical protein
VDNPGIQRVGDKFGGVSGLHGGLVGGLYELLGWTLVLEDRRVRRGIIPSLFSIDGNQEPILREPFF